MTVKHRLLHLHLRLRLRQLVQSAVTNEVTGERMVLTDVLEAMTEGLRSALEHMRVVADGLARCR